MKTAVELSSLVRIRRLAQRECRVYVGQHWPTRGMLKRDGAGVDFTDALADRGATISYLAELDPFRVIEAIDAVFDHFTTLEAQLAETLSEAGRMVAGLRDDAEQAEARAVALEAANQEMANCLRWLATYEKDPPEILKDDWAYDRFLTYVHTTAQTGLSRAGLDLPKGGRS